MTDNTDDVRDWDDELNDLVDGVLEDGREDAPEDVVDMPDKAESPEEAAQPSQAGDKDIAELLAERTLDLQRLQAEYVNYKRRVDRDRNVSYQRGVEAVLAELLPVLDGIDAAKAHGELNGGAVMLADEVNKVAAKHGLTSFGEEGEPFNPHIHEALMTIDKPGYSVPSVAQVFQKGYSIGDRILRPARVGVAEAELEPDNSTEPAGGDGDPASGRMTTEDGGDPGGDGDPAFGRMTTDDGSDGDPAFGRMTTDDGRMTTNDGGDPGGDGDPAFGRMTTEDGGMTTEDGGMTTDDGGMTTDDGGMTE